MTKVYMVQLNKLDWELRAGSGKILVEGLKMGSRHEAEQWVRAYISSYPSWTYQMVPKHEV